MGCATSKDRVERTSAVEAESFTVSSDMQKLQLQEALSKGSFLFTQERSASAELAMPETRPAEASVEAARTSESGADVEPVGTAKCTSDYESGEDIDLQLKQVSRAYMPVLFPSLVFAQPPDDVSRRAARNRRTGRRHHDRGED